MSERPATRVDVSRARLERGLPALRVTCGGRQVGYGRLVRFEGGQVVQVEGSAWVEVWGRVDLVSDDRTDQQDEGPGADR